MPDAVVLEAPTSEPVTPPEPTSPLECGDWIWPVFYRSFIVGHQEQGSWETTQTRIVSVGKDLVCYEVSNPSTDPDSASHTGSSLRWTPKDRVFRIRENALNACRTLPAPK